MTHPYGAQPDGSARCVNAEPGTFNHECGRPAMWIGTSPSGFSACYCNPCKEAGWEAIGVKAWERLPMPAVSR